MPARVVLLVDIYTGISWFCYLLFCWLDGLFHRRNWLTHRSRSRRGLCGPLLLLLLLLWLISESVRTAEVWFRDGPDGSGIASRL